MFDFPNAPTNGQLVTGPSGQIYIWDGTSWNVSPSTAPWSINQVGTGATTAPAALANLGAVAKAGDTMTGALNLTIPLAVPSGGTGAVDFPIQPLTGISPTGTFLLGHGTGPVTNSTESTGTIQTYFGHDIAIAAVLNSPVLSLMLATGGTLAAPTALTTGIPCGAIYFGGYDGAGWYAAGSAGIVAMPTENWVSGASGKRGTNFIFSTTAIGAANSTNT